MEEIARYFHFNDVQPSIQASFKESFTILSIESIE